MNQRPIFGRAVQKARRAGIRQAAACLFAMVTLLRFVKVPGEGTLPQAGQLERRDLDFFIGSAMSMVRSAEASRIPMSLGWLSPVPGIL